MGNYFRVGNTTVTLEEKMRLTPQDVKRFEADAVIAEEKRLANIRRSQGISGPQNVTLDVTPAAVAARKAAIEVEAARIAAETKEVEVELGEPGASFTVEGEETSEVQSRRGRKPKQATV